MKELSTPAFPQSQAFLSTSANFLGIAQIDWGVRQAVQPPAERPEGGGITAVWAEHLDQVRAAQRLRFSVFALEMGAHLQTPANSAYPEHDIDI